jgi:transcriptional regulator with XRE-family HTH domain
MHAPGHGKTKQMSFGRRLAEERKRLGLTQVGFADLAGTSAAKQSLYENDRRELRAAYLARLVEAGVDVVYVLIGRRSAGRLGEAPTELLTAHFALPLELQQALAALARALREQTAARRVTTAMSSAEMATRPASLA